MGLPASGCAEDSAPLCGKDYPPRSGNREFKSYVPTRFSGSTSPETAVTRHNIIPISGSHKNLLSLPLHRFLLLLLGE